MANGFFSRVTKTALALIGNQLLHFLMQFILPPLFLVKYGVKDYSEWLVLSAAIGFLGFLDLGLQTYVANRLTVFYHNGDLKGFHRFQSTGLLMSFGVLLSTAVLTMAVFFVPISRWLSVTMPSVNAAAVLYLLVLQVLAFIFWGQLASAYRAIGQAYRGVMWYNLQKLVMLAVTIAAVASKCSFIVIALGQLLVALSSLLFIWLDLRLKFKEVSPQLAGFDWILSREILKPSLYFSLFVFNNFLIFQLPVLILNRFEAPLAIISFSVGRTLFSLVRQGLSVIQASIGPEITRLEGIKDWNNLKQLYLRTESLTISASVTFNTVIFAASPLLLLVWMKRSDVFSFGPMLVLMLISAVMGLKEFKYYFQTMTNRHEKTAVMMILSYLLMSGASYFAAKHYGLTGLLLIWLIIEITQLSIIHQYNVQLFKNIFKLSAKPTEIMGVLLIVFTMLFIGCNTLFYQSTVKIILVASMILVVMTFVSYYFFNGKEVIELVKRRITGKIYVL